MKLCTLDTFDGREGQPTSLLSYVVNREGVNSKTPSCATSSFFPLTPTRLSNPPASLQDIAFQVMAGAYGIIALVALVQLFRIQIRIPEYG